MEVGRWQLRHPHRVPLPAPRLEQPLPRSISLLQTVLLLPRPHLLLLLLPRLHQQVLSSHPNPVRDQQFPRRLLRRLPSLSMAAQEVGGGWHGVREA